MAFVLYNFIEEKVYAHNQEHTSQLPFDSPKKLYSNQFITDLKKILDGAEPLDSKIFILEMSEIAENGSIVPFKMSVSHPMNDSDYVKALHLLSTLNPNAWVASFFLTPRCGKAEISGRMKLAKTQDVFALAQLSNDQFLVTYKKVEVLIGGCDME